MEYRSPDPEAFRNRADRLTDALKNAASFEEADRAFREFETLCSGFDTACSICMVRHELNTLDEYYDAEFERIDEISPKIEERSRSSAESSSKARSEKILTENTEACSSRTWSSRSRLSLRK